MHSIKTKFFFTSIFILLFSWIYWFRGLRVRQKKPILINDIRKILLIRLDHIGDFILTTPLLRELRSAVPHAQISLLVSKEVAPLAETCPYIDELIVSPIASPRWCGYKINYLQVIRFFPFYFNRLIKQNFDLAISIKRGSYQHLTRAVTFLSGARWRLGYHTQAYSDQEILYNGTDLKYLNCYYSNPHTLFHEVEYNLSWLRTFGKEPMDSHCELWVPKQTFKECHSLINRSRRSPSSPLIALGIGASHPIKRWPLDKFSQLIHRCIVELRAEIILLGSPEEAFLGKLLCQRHSRLLNFIGKTTLPQAHALLYYCQLFIGSDSAPKHMAAIHKIPVIELQYYPLTNARYTVGSPLLFRSWQTKNVILQPLNEEPISNIQVDDVFHHVKRFLKPSHITSTVLSQENCCALL